MRRGHYYCVVRLFYALCTAAVIFLASSCGVIQIAGLTHGISSLTDENRGLITLEVNHQDNEVRLVNASQLLESFPKDSYSVVYLYNIACASDVCIPPSRFASTCEESSVVPFVLIEYFTDDIFDATKGLNRYGINSKEYNSKYAFRYLPRFVKELTKGKITDVVESYYIFYGDEFIRSADSIDEAIKVIKERL